MPTNDVSNVSDQANPANIPQFNWRQLAGFILLPIAWWFILLYGITPLLLPAFSASNGEPNGWLLLSIAALGYLFEFFLALTIFRKEGYSLNFRTLKERIHWHWPRGWKTWGIILIVFVLGVSLTMLMQPLNAVTTRCCPRQIGSLLLNTRSKKLTH